MPVNGVMVRRFWQNHLPTFLMVFGPGLIVMEADIDAGALSTYGRTRSICSCAGI
jgi:Mn2+/Fe2+ NRAMP family transporter